MSFRRLQLEFAAHLRDPENAPPPAGIEPRRMAVYRELFINNVAGLLAGTFPVCKAILGEEGWTGLVRRFYARHKAHTPYFLELPREFTGWLADGAGGAAGLPPFLAELAHYEWVELALSITDADLPAADADGDLISGAPVISPFAWPLAYRWPVHRLSRTYQPEAPPSSPTFIVVHRDHDSAEVRFLEIDAATARLLQLMEESPGIPGAELIERIVAEMPAAEPARLRSEGERMLRTLRERNIVLGAQTGTES
ncbi:MAG: hypothetical protein AMJ58_07380 [Gammaproteobacteria bacterium SG8_30]|nr:MAG: hypothetical protein AMJ58_07380 [Gammaproteobacteria bacterium SG8_30]